MFKEAITPALMEVASVLCKIPELASFRIVGGTAIALQLGHRKSVDIDFFSNEQFDKNFLRKILKTHFKSTEFFISPQQVSAEINGVRVELYDDWLVPFRTSPIVMEGLRMASLDDLAAFKLSTITGRREKKDYIDLYFLFSYLELDVVLARFKDYDPLLSPKSILFALTEVKEAILNQSFMPKMLKPFSWDDVQNLMIKAGELYLEMMRRADK